MTTKAEAKRLEVLRRIGDVYDEDLYESSSRYRSVRTEVRRLERDGLIEPCQRDGEIGWRRTTAGDAALIAVEPAQ